jgi:ferredoxin-NADP reductase
MVKPNHRVTTVVRRIGRETERVFTYELADPDDWELPPFASGAHIDVHVPGGRVRQYSLYNDPAESNRYRVAVQREHGGRGGSERFQDTVREGDTLLVSLPRNHFPLTRGAKHHLLVAGGIGITPMLSMIAELERADASWELHYCTRTPDETPFRAELQPFAERGRVGLYHTRFAGAERLDINAVIGGAGAETHVYCCGPERMIHAVVEAAADRPQEMLHFEHFGAPAVATSGESFEVELAQSRQMVRVPAGQTILSALREAGVELDASCEGGVCLSCKTRYLAGIPVHRDLVMKPEDRREFMTPCVSGCASEKLVLDL